jgi:membrane-bound metal-dependent hydrolase YbcI (DUF457 family)
VERPLEEISFMFIGHYAVGWAGRGALGRSPRGPSLGTWFLAIQWLDLIWPPLVLLGIEEVRIDPGNTAFTPLNFVSYPYSHSLLMAAAWAVAFGAVYRWRSGDARGGFWLAGGVFSHWVLDWVTHGPDLPLYPGSAVRVGLGLWNSVPASLVVEIALFVVGVGLYARATRASDRRGVLANWGLVALLAAIYLANVLGPPPPGVGAVAWSALSLWLLAAWGYWIDRHRVPRGDPAPAALAPGSP